MRGSVDVDIDVDQLAYRSFLPSSCISLSVDGGFWGLCSLHRRPRPPGVRPGLRWNMKLQKLIENPLWSQIGKFRNFFGKNFFKNSSHWLFSSIWWFFCGLVFFLNCTTWHIFDGGGLAEAKRSLGTSRPLRWMLPTPRRPQWMSLKRGVQPDSHL